MSRRLAYLYIATAAFCWGIIGIFISYLYELGFNPTQVVAIRLITAAVVLFLYVYFTNRHLLKIKLSDSKYFIGTGIVSLVFFNWCLFNALQETTIAIAAILLYTAPAFVTILSRLFFKEPLTARKLSALFVTFIGCAFVIGVFPSTSDSISTYGLILGIGAGLFYALYSIFGKFALMKYDSITVTIFTFIFGAVAIAPFSGLSSVIPLILNIKAVLCIIGLGIVSTVFAFTLYTKGLSAVESSRASIIATIEPVIAALSGFLVFNERLGGWQYIGILMVIAAVIIVQERNEKEIPSDLELNHSSSSGEF